MPIHTPKIFTKNIFLLRAMTMKMSVGTKFLFSFGVYGKNERKTGFFEEDITFTILPYFYCINSDKAKVKK